MTNIDKPVHARTSTAPPAPGEVRMPIQLDDGRTAVPVDGDGWEIGGRTALRNEDGSWTIEPDWAEVGDVTPEQEMRAAGHPAAQDADYEPPQARAADHNHATRLVWVAVARQGIEYHRPEPAKVTTCGRTTRYGQILPHSEVTDRFGSRPCRRCYPEGDGTVPAADGAGC